MKLQVAFDHTDLEACITIAHKIEHLCDQFEIGSLLLHTHGIAAVKTFKDIFHQKTIIADTKIVERGKDIAQLYFDAGADCITVMAGTHQQIIHTVGSVAQNNGKQVMLDLFDTNLLGQAAMDAKSLGMHALVFHQPLEQRATQNTWYDKWDIVRGNTTLPVFIGSEVSKETIHEMLEVKPDGLILQGSVTQSKNPEAELLFFKETIDAFKAQKQEERNQENQV